MENLFSNKGWNTGTRIATWVCPSLSLYVRTCLKIEPGPAISGLGLEFLILNEMGFQAWALGTKSSSSIRARLHIHIKYYTKLQL